MSSMPSSGTLQAKRHRELHGVYRNEGDEAGGSGQQRIGGQRFMSPNRLESKYTDPQRTSSSSFKPPMLKDSMKKPKIPDPSENQQSSLSSAFSYLKNVFTGRGSAQTPTSTSNTVYNDPIIKIMERNVESIKKTKVENGELELKDVSDDKDPKEAAPKIEEGDDVGTSPPNGKALKETETPAPNAKELKNETKATKPVHKKPWIPFSYDPKKLVQNKGEDFVTVADNSQEFIPPTILPSLPTDSPLDKKSEARLRKIEQFKKRHLILPPTVLEPQISVSNSIATTQSARSLHSDKTSRPEYIFPPRELRSHLTDSSRSLSPKAIDRWHQESSRSVNQKPYHKAQKNVALSSPNHRGRRSAGSPGGDISKQLVQRSGSGGSTAYRIRSSPVLSNSYNFESGKRSSRTETGQKKSGRTSPSRPENRWQKNSSISRALASPSSARNRSKSTSDKTIANYRSAYTNRGAKPHKRAKSSAGKLTSPTTFTDDRDLPVVYQKVSPEYKQRKKRASTAKSLRSARKVTSNVHQGPKSSLQSISHDAQNSESDRQFVASNSQYPSPPRVSIPSTPSPRESAANLPQSRSPEFQSSAQESLSNTQPTVKFIQRPKSPSLRSPTAQSPTTAPRSPSMPERSSSPGRSSPAMAWQQSQQSPPLLQRSQQSPVHKSSPPWRNNQIPNQQYIRKNPTSKRTPPIRQVSTKDATSVSNAASHKGSPNKSSHSYSRGALLDSHESSSHGDFFVIHKQTRGFGVRSQPDSDDNARPKSSRQLNSPKNQFSKRPQAQSSYSMSPRSKGSHGQSESKWSLRNKITSKYQSHSPRTKGKQSSQSPNQAAWKRKNQFLRQTSPPAGNQKLNRHIAQSTLASENRSASRQSLEPTITHMQEDVQPPRQTPPVPTEMRSPFSGSQTSLNASTSMIGLPTPPAEASPSNGPLDGFEVVSVSVSSLDQDSLNYGAHLDAQPKLNSPVAGNNEIHAITMVPSSEIVNYCSEDIYQGAYLNTPTPGIDGVEEPIVNQKNSSNSIKSDFIDGNLSNSSSSYLDHYMSFLSAEASDIHLNDPIVDHLVDCSNSALYNSPTPTNNTGPSYNENEMLQDPIHSPESENSIGMRKNKNPNDTPHSTAHFEQPAKLQKSITDDEKRAKSPHDSHNALLAQAGPHEKTSPPSTTGTVADVYGSRISPIREAHGKNNPLPGVSKANENKASVEPPLLQADTRKYPLTVKKTIHRRREEREKAREEECKNCIPFQSKLSDESSRGYSLNQMPMAFKNMGDLSPQTNKREKRISKARRQNLQGLIKSRSPPTDTSPLKYREEGASYSPDQTQLTWGRNAAASAATAAVGRAGEKGYPSHQKQSSRQFEPSAPEEKDSDADRKDSTGVVMKKTLSFFSSFFKSKDTPSAELEVQNTQERAPEKDTVSAKPDYVRNGATVSTFYESLNKNRSSSHWLMPKLEREGEIENGDSKSMSSLESQSNVIRMSKSDKKRKDLPEVSETDTSPLLSQASEDPDDFSTAQTMMGELP